MSNLFGLLAGLAAVLLAACSSPHGTPSAPHYRYSVSNQPAPPARQVLRRSIGLSVTIDLRRGMEPYSIPFRFKPLEDN